MIILYRVEILIKWTPRFLGELVKPRVGNEGLNKQKGQVQGFESHKATWWRSKEVLVIFYRFRQKDVGAKIQRGSSGHYCMYCPLSLLHEAPIISQDF